MNDSLTPPPAGGGNAKYAAIGLLLLLGGGGGIYALTRTEAPPPAPPTPVVRDAGPPIATNSSVGAVIELPPEVPDAGPPPDVSTAPRIRYVTRYVNECSGTVDIAAVQRTAQANYGALRSCYERELRANPALRGALTAQLKVNSTGHLDGVRVATGMSSTSLVNCVKSALMRLTYPASRGGCAVAEVRFNFTPRE
ncbi:MAG: AgmX/PglI C-terminal domain-containing protein [Deltaproteobacteria bacterium]|nr:AgmX/PglI C-terminal domain-containing protein [Myxococcales bacterium]MDP3218347.1 AgmX/PglI C-terminal domain-containing protein [Deltaproteobacteria bacterium]